MPPRFADIPMPHAVAALPVTSSGMPVPYTTLYIADEPDPTELESLPSGGMIMRCRCVFGVGRPRFGKPCPHRQRHAMSKRRCVVCGRKVPPTMGAVFLGVTMNALPIGPRWTSIEPPAHPACAAYSAVACPRLYGDPSDVVVAVTPAYDTWRHVVVGVKDGQTVGRAMPPEEPLAFGAVDLHVAVLGRTPVYPTTLTDWMTTAAPPPYGELFSG